MKRVGLVVLALLFIISTVFAAGMSTQTPRLPKGHVDKLITGQEHLRTTQVAPRPDFFNELDEFVGDTIIVGFTYWESQHNGTVGRMIGYYPEEWSWLDINFEQQTVNSAAFMSYMCLEDAAEAADRHVRLNRVGYNGEGIPMVEFTGANGYAGGGARVDGGGAGSRAGYTTFSMDPINGKGFPAYHFVSGGPTVSKVSAELLPDFHGTFSETQVPDHDNGLDNIWPKSVYSEYNGTKYVHIVTHSNRDDDPTGQMDILYSRHEFNPDFWSFTPGDPQLVTDNGMNISADIAVSDDGSRVAITQTISRDYRDWPGEDPSQTNNDIYLWESLDGGETWDWDNPFNVTDFAPPNPDLLPELADANTDTFRAYTDMNVYYDHNDRLHVAFTTPMFYFFDYDEESGDIVHYRGGTWTSIIWHWDEEHNNYTMLADGTFWNYCFPGAWHRVVNRPSMYHDPVSGILWCSFQQFGMPGERTYIDDENLWGWDASDDFYASGEVMLTASPPDNELGDWFGQLWTDPVNLTNTRADSAAMDDRLEAYECRSEREPSISLNNDGSYLHLMYVEDYDAGFIVQEEGEFTLNDVVYHRVAKQTVIDQFDGWLYNFPMKHDSIGFWADPYDSAWTHDDWVGENPFYRGYFDAVGEKDGLLPHEFSLEQNYPNPFNPTTNISFSLAKYSKVTLAVYDVLGREVATLVDRQMNRGFHQVTFDGSELSSGMYFIKLTSGDNAHVRKMVLMK